MPRHYSTKHISIKHISIYSMKTCSLVGSSPPHQLRYWTNPAFCTKHFSSNGLLIHPVPRVVVTADPHVQVHEPTLMLLSACTTCNLCSFVQASSGSIYLSCGLRGACGSHLPHWSTRPQKHLDSSSWLSSSPGQSCPPKTAPTTNRQLIT